MGLETKVGRLIYDLQSLVNETTVAALLEANTNGDVDLNVEEIRTVASILSAAYAPKFEGAITQLQAVLNSK